MVSTHYPVPESEIQAVIAMTFRVVIIVFHTAVLNFRPSQLFDIESQVYNYIVQYHITYKTNKCPLMKGNCKYNYRDNAH